MSPEQVKQEAIKLRGKNMEEPISVANKLKMVSESDETFNHSVRMIIHNCHEP